MPTLIRTMTSKDLTAASALSASFGWPHRPADWETFLALGEGFVGEVDGQVRATVMGFRHGTDVATVGMMIVDRMQQGMGLGSRLMLAMMERLQDKTIVLQATPAGVRLYAQLGFRVVGELMQHQGTVSAVAPPALEDGERLAFPSTITDGIQTLYAAAAGGDRDAVLTALMQTAQCVALERNGEIVGFSLLRPFGRGWCVGPVVAPDPASARALIQYWLADNLGRYVRVDLVDREPLSDWLAGIGLPLADGARTMAIGRWPLGANDHYHALAAHALG